MNVYEKIAANGTPQQVLELAAQVNRFELESEAKQLSDGQLVQLGQWTSDRLTATGAQGAIWLGGTLLLYRLPTDNAERGHLFQEMLDDLGISLSKAYDAIRIFEYFGALFFANKELMKHFPERALRHLAADKVTPEARATAIDMAQRGERCTIDIAIALVRQHAAEVEEGGSSSPTSTDTAPRGIGRGQRLATVKPKWSFTGDCMKFKVEAAQVTRATDPELIRRDWQAALDAFLLENGLSTDTQHQPDAA